MVWDFFFFLSTVTCSSKLLNLKRICENPYMYSQPRRSVGGPGTPKHAGIWSEHWTVEGTARCSLWVAGVRTAPQTPGLH